MLKEKEIEIKISSSNYNHYLKKYGPYKNYDKILIDIDDLPENSTVKVTAICEICGKEVIMKYQPYNIQIKKGSYYCCNKCKNIKTRESNKIKYGVEHTLQRKEVIEKSKKSLLEKYNVENISQRNDIRQIRSDRLKSDGYQQKMLDGIISKYGVNNVSKLQFIQDKKDKTMMSNYGVTNPSQSSFLFEKSQKSGKRIKYDEETKIYYRGTYELDFLKFCIKNKLIVEKGPSISFTYKNKHKVYHSDFLLPELNMVCEIKSDYYYDKYLELNLVKKQETLKYGYNFIFIINKNYEDIFKLF